MVGSLGHAVRASNDQSREVVVAHLVGLLMGSLLTASGLILVGGLLAELPQPFQFAAAILPALLVVGLQLTTGRVMQSTWQVPERWRFELDVDLLAFAYGLLLGMGLPTAVVVATFWLFVSLSTLTTPSIVFLAWTAYAIARFAGFHRQTRRAASDGGFAVCGLARRSALLGSLALGAVAAFTLA